MRISNSLFLLALSLGGFAGVNVSDGTRDLLLAMAALAVGISLWLLWTGRGGDQQKADPPAARGLPWAVLAVASVLSWGALGIVLAKQIWPAALVALVAAILVTVAIWRRLRLEGSNSS